MKEKWKNHYVNSISKSMECTPLEEKRMGERCTLQTAKFVLMIDD